MARKKRGAGREKSTLPEGEVRLATNVPEQTHRKLKIEAAKRGTTIRQLIIEFARKL